MQTTKPNQGVSIKDREEVKQAIHDSIGWALNKDLNRLFAIMAQDEDFFVFHPDSKSTVRGFEAFRKMAEKSWMNENFKATDFAVKELKINFSKSGTVAWYTAFLDDHGEWKGQRIGWDDARWTGVLEKRENQWVIVQMHFSFAKDD
jgi:ketosteroid isomerase-like protein